jgi:hypothetical protein
MAQFSGNDAGAMSGIAKKGIRFLAGGVREGILMDAF